MTPPSRLGAYPIERELGRGGMGIVYLGHDPRLGRAVAIKVLPEALATDPERLARFDREARVLASLNHPNIAGIYGLEEADGVKFLLLEYVEGETLAERLVRGPLPVDEALDICRQIAAALESAHENGIIHRDLKPGNVKLTPGGDVKVLDFGLAKGDAGSDSVSNLSLTHSPTRALSATDAGMILGTAAYMSPEQARGKPLDRRTDIWSFGAVLFECLSGKQAFAGETISDIIATILQGEPPWHQLPARTPPGILTLLRRCLEKDARKRLRDLGDARLEIEHVLASPRDSVSIAQVPGRRVGSVRRYLPWAMALVFAATTTGFALLHFKTPSGTGPLLRLSAISPIQVADADAVYSSLSPEGTRVAFAADDSTGRRSLWLMNLETKGLTKIVDEDGIPFWSPDGSRIGFFTLEKLKILDLGTGNIDVLCPASFGRGATWNGKGVILFAATGEGPLVRISENGGPVTQVTALDTTRHETAHRYPCFLPDGQHFLYVSLPAHEGQFDVFVGDLTSKEKTFLFATQGAPIYVPPGYLLYPRNGRLAAQRFDASRRRVVGEPVSLGDAPGATSYSGSPRFSASQIGSLCILNAPSAKKRLAWYDASGKLLATIPVQEAAYEDLALSPDNRRAVVLRRTSSTETDLWIVDLERGFLSRFTFGPGEVSDPVWSPDGSRIAFASNRDGPEDIFVRAVNGASTDTPLLQSRMLFKETEDWSQDGKYLLYRQLGETTAWDLWALPMDGHSEPFSYLDSPFDEQNASFSPDGRWVMYESNESGRGELYVQSFPQPGQKFQISTSGSRGGSWSADGRRIAYAATNGDVTIVDVVGGATFQIGNFHRGRFPVKDPLSGGDVDSKLERLLGMVKVETANANSFTLVLNWPEALKR